MIAYKLFRVLKDNSITSLFINKSRKLPLNVWLEAESFPTKGFTLRPFWHCTSNPTAPHLSLRSRKWYKIEMEDYEEFNRPKSQGGLWYLAKRIKIIEPIKF
jgi:hypothetical protein